LVYENVCMIVSSPTERISAISQWKTFTRVLPARWRRKPAGIEITSLSPYVFHFLHSFVRVHHYCNKTRLPQTEERAIFRVTIDGRAVNYVCGECIASTVEPPRGDRRKYGQQARPSMSIDSTTNLPWRSLDFETVPDALPAAQPTASKHWRHFQTV